MGYRSKGATSSRSYIKVYYLIGMGALKFFYFLFMRKVAVVFAVLNFSRALCILLQIFSLFADSQINTFCYKIDRHSSM